jgi:hypothetical protein
MDKAATFAAGMPVGPVCAQRRGLMPTTIRKTKTPTQKQQDTDTLDLFEEK